MAANSETDIPAITNKHENNADALRSQDKQSGDSFLSCAGKQYTSTNQKDPSKSTWTFESLTTGAVADINIRTPADDSTRTCRITGITLLEGDTTLAVADMINNCVKLIDVGQKDVLSRVELLDWPWDITRINSEEFVVTVPMAFTIQFLTVVNGTTLSLGRQIRVSAWCHGIAYNNDKLFITSLNPPQIQILDMSGSVLTEISAQTFGRTRFRNPFYLALGRDLTTLFVCDFDNRCVYGVDFDGVERFKYKGDRRLDDVYGVCVADNDTIIMCERFTSHLHIVSLDCGSGRILLDESHGIQYPACVAYSSQLSTLYVGQEGDILKVFKLT